MPFQITYQSTRNTKHMKRTFLQILGKCTILQLSKQRFSISGELTCMFPSSLFPTTYYKLHILFVIQVCKNFWYSRIFGINILTKNAQCAVILEQWEMWCVWYWYQHCMASSFTQCLWYLIIWERIVWSEFLIQQMIFQSFAILSQSASFKRIILVRLRDKRKRINHL